MYEKIVVDVVEQDGPAVKRRKRGENLKAVDYWKHRWGRMYLDSKSFGKGTVEYARFRRRFRVPAPFFREFVERCREVNVFGNIYECAKIPYEIKNMACLRVLGRDVCFDEIADNIGIPAETVRTLFHKFVDGVTTTKLFPQVVRFPEDEDLERVLSEFRSIGFPGCIGSIDCTHIAWDRSPFSMTNSTKGKEGYPTLAFQAAVDRSGKVIHISKGYVGSNDPRNCQKSGTNEAAIANTRLVIDAEEIPYLKATREIIAGDEILWIYGDAYFSQEMGDEVDPTPTSIISSESSYIPSK